MKREWHGPQPWGFALRPPEIDISGLLQVCFHHTTRSCAVCNVWTIVNVACEVSALYAVLSAVSLGGPRRTQQSHPPMGIGPALASIEASSLEG